MNYLYFTEADLNSIAQTGEGAMYPASAFLGADPVSATTTRLSFKARNGTAKDDDVLIEHASGKHVEVAELIASVLEPSPVTRTKFIVVADEANGIYLDNGNGAGLTGTVEVTTLA
tara:strand:- start:808 stop:1155 length:348 start_codon:yes stop_codon:yes gene_type:complete